MKTPSNLTRKRCHTKKKSSWNRINWLKFCINFFFNFSITFIPTFNFCMVVFFQVSVVFTFRKWCCIKWYIGKFWLFSYILNKIWHIVIGTYMIESTTFMFFFLRCTCVFPAKICWKNCLILTAFVEFPKTKLRLRVQLLCMVTKAKKNTSYYFFFCTTMNKG